MNDMHCSELMDSNKYDILFFSNVLINQKTTPSSLIDYFTKKGHRVFYFTLFPVMNYSKGLISKNLTIIELPADDHYSLNWYLKDIIEKNHITDAIIYTENEKWETFLNLIKDTFNFRLIYNIKINTINSIDSLEKMFKISDIICTDDSNLHDFLFQKKININYVETIKINDFIENYAKELYPLISIIIVTYNNLDYTKLCLLSIIHKTAYPNYEIIVVDNNSTDGTKDYLEEFQLSYPIISLIFNNENKGFAKGNNIGIKIAKGKYIVILNNDTIVTKGWLSHLLNHMENNKSLGLLGPVTNNCGNESKIEVTYSKLSEMDDFAYTYTSQNNNKLYSDISMLPMFCVIFRKSIINEIGYLDEQFKIGMFEDDDFCIRIKNQGYSLACAEDVFIHHFGSVSFESISNNAYGEIFNENKSLFENKWGITWTPHKYRHEKASSVQTNFDIIILSIIDWSFRYQRPHHLASFFAKSGYRVFYFNVSFEKDLSTINHSHNLDLISLNNSMHQNIYYCDFNNNIEEITKSFDNIINKNSIKNCAVIVEYPNWFPITAYLQTKYNFKIITDYLDEFSGFDNKNAIVNKYYQALLYSSNLIVSSSSYLYNKSQKYNKNCALIRNGTDFSHFYKAYKEYIPQTEKTPIIGYYGAIADWFDIDKIEYIADQRPDWTILLIGDITINIDNLKKFRNIKLLGEKKYAHLPHYLRSFDVCLIPFKSGLDLISATNPIKFYEYLSAGKKIVATEIPELIPYNERFVYTTNNNFKFLEYIESCLSNTDNLHSDQEKLTFARMQDWKIRCTKFEFLIKLIVSNGY